MSGVRSSEAPRLGTLDLVVFDKDGTLIDFDAMWAGWTVGLAARLEAAVGRSIRDPLYDALGFDPASGHAIPGGPLAATPMAELRALTVATLGGLGLPSASAEAAVEVAWSAPDPVATAAPLTDLAALFGALRAAGTRVAVATSDDRAPTEATLAALGVAGLVDGSVCADDGIPVKPDPAPVLALCARLGVAPAATAVVGDSPADVAMGRRAGAGLVIGVLSGVGNVADLGPDADLIVASVADLRA